MKETVLLFHIQDEVRLQALKRILMLMKVRVKVVDKADYLQPVGYLAGIKELQTEQIYEGDELEEEMMIMAGFSNQQVDTLLAKMRKASLAKIHYKAILTPMNATWSTLQLYEELKKEHEYMLQMHSKK
ncbi:hypothetical protein NDGK_02743 [Clostridiales bacterium CHKCI001]|nr:hypothetical protein NDGK_02743 [Clostridiales bacterium CHKCI001]